jgi:hypothetical protein
VIATRTLSGAISGDDVSYTGGTASFSDKNAATGKTVTATGLGLGGTSRSGEAQGNRQDGSGGLHLRVPFIAGCSAREEEQGLYQRPGPGIFMVR